MRSILTSASIPTTSNVSYSKRFDLEMNTTGIVCIFEHIGVTRTIKLQHTAEVSHPRFIAIKLVNVAFKLSLKCYTVCLIVK